MPDYGLTGLIKGIREGSAARRLHPLEEGAEAAAARQRAAIPSVAPELQPLEAVVPTVEPPAIGAIASEPPVVLRETPELGAAIDVEAEAPRLQALNLGHYDLGADWQPNYDMIATTDDVKALIADTAERQKAKIQTARRGTMSHDEVRLLSEDMGVQQRAVDGMLRREAGGDLPPVEVVRAMRQIVLNSADRLLTLAKSITAKQATDLDKVRFRRQIQLHNELTIGFMGVRAEYGRGLGVFGIPLDVDVNPAAARRLAELLDNVDGRSIDSIAAEIATATKPKEIAKIVRRTLSEKIGGVIKDVAYGSALSSPTTHEINIFGGPLFLGMNIAETALGRQIGKLLPGGTSIKEGEAASMLFGALTGVHDAFRYTWEAMKKGEPVSGLKTRRGETEFQRGISSKALFDRGTSGNSALDGAINLLRAAIRVAPERLMIPGDELIKGVARNMEAARLGYLKALDRAEQGPITRDEFASLIREYMDNPDPGALEDEAIRATFQTRMPERIAKLAQSIRSWPGGFLVAMFVKTPTNLFIEGLGKRSPLAIFNASVRRDIAAGGRARDIAIARITLGSLTSALIASYTAGGNITGLGPKGPEREMWLKKHPPYSFRYLDPFSGEWKWQSYGRVEPLAYVIGATADAVEMMAALGDADEQSQSPQREAADQVSKAAAIIVGAVAQNTLNKTLMTGVADFISAIDDPGRYMLDYVQRLGSLMIPWSAFRGKINQIEDPLVREAWTFMDELKNRSGIPGWSEDAPARRDPFGEVKKWPTGEIQGPLSPYPSQEVVDDPLIEELLQVSRHTGKMPVTMPGKKVEGMKLTAQEYDDLVIRSRTEPDRSGRTFREALDELVDSTTYQNAAWDERYLLLHAVQERYDSRIRGAGSNDPGTMERENMDFADRLAEFRIRKQDAMEGL